MINRKLKIAVCAAATLSLLAITTPAEAVVAAAGPGGFQVGYATPVVVVPVGGPLTFVNGDIQPHNVIAYEDFLPKKKAKKTKKFPWCKLYPKKKCPIFRSDTVPIGGVTEVMGLENLESGQQYTFFCSIHPNMKGTLVAI